MTTNMIAFFITADFALLIFAYCLKTFFFADEVESVEVKETIADRP